MSDSDDIVAVLMQPRDFIAELGAPLMFGDPHEHHADYLQARKRCAITDRYAQLMEANHG